MPPTSASSCGGFSRSSCQPSGVLGQDGDRGWEWMGAGWWSWMEMELGGRTRTVSENGVGGQDGDRGVEVDLGTEGWPWVGAGRAQGRTPQAGLG